MIIADYDSLIASVKSYAARSDSSFNTALPVFVGLAEERLYNGQKDPGGNSGLDSDPLRISVMETSATLTLTSGAATLPDTYLAMRALARSGDTIGLKYLPPERQLVQIEIESAGTPVWYSIQGATLSVVPVWSGTLTAIYYQRFPAITSSNKTGSLMSAAGLCYLEATLIEAFAWMREPEIALGHAAKLRGMIGGINRSATELRYSGPLRVRQRMAVP